MEKKLRSFDWFGKSDKMGFVHRSWLRNQGYPDDYFKGRPVIGICNTWSELTPCNGHLRDFAEVVKRGVIESGGFPNNHPECFRAQRSIKMQMKKILVILLLASNCCNAQYKTTGSIERLDLSLDKIISTTAKIEIIAEGFDWSEGPVWVEQYKMLLWSDVPRDTIFKWTEKKGKEIYLTPSGYTGTVPRGGEMGSNGLLLDKKGRLVLCQCGNRQMAIMNAALDKPAPNYLSLAAAYNGKKFNSPNDAVFNSKGELFFTDPPYGLEKQMNDPNKEIPFQGVYKVKTNGEVVLLLDSITRPNGIAFLPGDKTLLISNSDPAKPNWYAFDIGKDGYLTNARIFYSTAGKPALGKGLPDGMKVDRNGHVFASGPGGIWIFNKDGKLLGKIKLTESASNCALSADEKTLYITNDMYVLRVKLRD